MGRGCLLEYSVCFMHTPPPSIPCSLEYVQSRQSRQLPRISGRTAASLCGKSAALVLMLRQRHRSIVCGNRERLRVSSRIPSASNKTLALARKRGNGNFLCMCSRTQSTTEPTKSSLKHSQKTLDTGHLHGGKVPM